MKTIYFLAPSLLVLSGCAATAPNWDFRFGDAARQARASQTFDPQAPSRQVAGQAIDGKALAGAMKAYAESYGYAVKEAPKPAFSLSTTVGK